MAKNKNTKNIVSEKKPQQKFIIKTSYECENCKHQCNKGKAYIKQIKISKKGNGIHCYERM